MDTTVMLGHGSGGTMMKRIIDEVFFAAYAGEELLRGDDAAVLPAPAQGERLAFSTDSFVVTPHFFPGGGCMRHGERRCHQRRHPALPELRLRVGRGLSYRGPQAHLR